MCKYRCLIIFLLINIIFAIGIGIFYTLKGILSFEVAFFSFFLVLISAYFNLKKKVQKEISQTESILEDPEEEAQEDKENTKPKTRFNFSNFVLGMQLSMGLWRVFAYIILIGGVVLLIQHNFFMIIPYVIGIGVCLFVVVTLKYLQEKLESKNESFE